MKSIRNLQQVPAGSMISSDDIIEFHAARLLLLILLCGKKELRTKLTKIEGLPKLAKLDFFVRYPAFFERVARELNEPIPPIKKTIESKMVRFHYGPWDERYYQILPYLEARNLLEVKKQPNKRQYRFYLTAQGEQIAEELAQAPEFSELINNMQEVKRVLSEKSGNELKKLVYKVFDY
jgi:hypothetical protein